jgi:hypothetical protein
MARSGTVIRFALLLAISGAATAQQETGSILGIVSGVDGAALGHAPMRAWSAQTATDARTYSSDAGRYEINGLAPGTYRIEVAMPCCTYAPFSSGDVLVKAGSALELDIRLEESGDLIALADDPGALAAEVLSRRVIPDAPVPSMVDGRPDLSGVWLVEDDPFPEEPEPLPWAEEAARQRDAGDLREDLFALCLPGELPIPGASIPMIARFLHTADLLVMLFEGPPGYRQVYLDGRGAGEVPSPSWLGHSVARWEGQTLVVDTVGFNARGRNGDYPRSEMMRLEERYTRTELGYMDLRMTIYDPGVFTRPWTRNLHLDLVPQEDLIEFVCENNKWLENGE